MSLSYWKQLQSRLQKIERKRETDWNPTNIISSSNFPKFLFYFLLMLLFWMGCCCCSTYSVELFFFVFERVKIGMREKIWILWNILRFIDIDSSLLAHSVMINVMQSISYSCWLPLFHLSIDFLFVPKHMYFRLLRTNRMDKVEN